MLLQLRKGVGIGMNVPKETIFKRITTKIKYYMKTKKLLASMKIEDFKNVSKVLFNRKTKVSYRIAKHTKKYMIL